MLIAADEGSAMMALLPEMSHVCGAAQNKKTLCSVQWTIVITSGPTREAMASAALIHRGYCRFLFVTPIRVRCRYGVRRAGRGEQPQPSAWRRSPARQACIHRQQRELCPATRAKEARNGASSSCCETRQRALCSARQRQRKRVCVRVQRRKPRPPRICGVHSRPVPNPADRVYMQKKIRYVYVVPNIMQCRKEHPAQVSRGEDDADDGAAGRLLRRVRVQVGYAIHP